jgi:restriction endonuclease Mrr
LSEPPHEEIDPTLVQLKQDICTSQIPQATQAEDEDNEEDDQAEKNADQIYNELTNNVLDEILEADSDNDERAIAEILDEQIKSVEAPGGTQAIQTKGSHPNWPEIEEADDEDKSPEGPDSERSD